LKSPAAYEKTESTGSVIQPATVFNEKEYSQENIQKEENNSIVKAIADFQEVIILLEAVYLNRKYFILFPIVAAALACVVGVTLIPERFQSTIPLLIDNSSLPAIRDEEEVTKMLNKLLGRVEYTQEFYGFLSQSSGNPVFRDLDVGQFSETPLVFLSSSEFNGLTLEANLPQKLFPQDKVKSATTLIQALNVMAEKYNAKQYNLKDIIMNKEIRIIDDKLKDMKYEREKLQDRKAKVWAESNAKLVKLEYHLKGIARDKNISLDGIEVKNKTVIEMTENLDFLSNSGVNANNLLRLLGLLESRSVLNAQDKEKYLNEVASIKSLFNRLDYDYSQSLKVFENLSKKKNELEKEKNESIAHSEVLLPLFDSKPSFLNNSNFSPFLESSSHSLLKSSIIGMALGIVIAFIFTLVSLFRRKVFPFLKKFLNQN